MLTPEQNHKSKHSGEFDICWQCGRSRETCNRKIRFSSVQEADDWVRELNAAKAYHNPVIRYCCRWCGGWHMARAKTKIQRGRAERQRRKWITSLFINENNNET